MTVEWPAGHVDHPTPVCANSSIAHRLTSFLDSRHGIMDFNVKINTNYLRGMGEPTDLTWPSVPHRSIVSYRVNIRLTPREKSYYWPVFVSMWIVNACKSMRFEKINSPLSDNWPSIQWQLKAMIAIIRLNNTRNETRCRISAPGASAKSRETKHGRVCLKRPFDSW